MTTTFTSSNLNIDIEKLKREIEISGTFIVNAIVPGVPLVTDTEVILDGTIVEPEYSAIQLIIDNHTNNKDSSSLSVTSNVKVQKNLQVDGTQTTFNTEEVTIEDHLIQINSNVVPPADPEEVFSGFEVMRGTQDSALFGYDERIGETPGFKTGLGLAGLSLIVTEATLSSIEISRSQLVAGTGSRVLFNDVTTGRVTESEDFQWLVSGANRSLLLQQSGVPFLFLTTGPTPHSYLTINSFAVNSEEFMVKDLTGSDTIFRVSSVGLNSVVTSTVDKFSINGKHGGLPRFEINRTLLADDVTIRTDNFSLLNSSGSSRLTFIESDPLFPTRPPLIYSSTETVFTKNNAHRIVVPGSDYGTFWRQDGTHLYLMVTYSGQQFGNWTDARPIMLNLATGRISIEASSININTTTITYPSGVSRSYTIPNMGTDSEFMMANGSNIQTVSNPKIYTGGQTFQGGISSTLPITINNNVALRFKNTGGTDINTLWIGNDNATYLNSATNLVFRTANTNHWEISSVGNIYPLVTGRVIADNTTPLWTLTTQNLVFSSASHGEIKQYVTTSGVTLGGGNDANGARIAVHGQDHPSVPGDILLLAGITSTNNNGGIKFYTYNTQRWTINGLNSTDGTAGSLIPQGNAEVNIGAVGRRVNVIRAALVVSPFTAGHFYVANENYTPEMGDAVKIVNRKLVKCDLEKDKKCIGIISGDCDELVEGIEYLEDSFGQRYTYDLEPNIKLYYVLSLGDSHYNQIDMGKLCDEGGPIEDGDLLCTANKSGFLKKQDDDLVHAYTVGQAKETVVFDENGEATGCYIYLFK